MSEVGRAVVVKLRTPEEEADASWQRFGESLRQMRGPVSVENAGPYEPGYAGIGKDAIRELLKLMVGERKKAPWPSQATMGPATEQTLRPTQGLQEALRTARNRAALPDESDAIETAMGFAGPLKLLRGGRSVPRYKGPTKNLLAPEAEKGPNVDLTKELADLLDEPGKVTILATKKKGG